MENDGGGFDRMKSFGLVLFAFPCYLLVKGRLINYTELA
jgi:hypothetical protein